LDNLLKKIFKRYIPYIKEYKIQYFLVFIGILLTVAATVATAEIMKYVFDDMLIEKKEEMLTLIPLAMIGIYFLKGIGRYIQSVFMSYIGQHMVSRFREILLDKIIHLDMGYLYLNASGGLISRVTNDITRIQYFVSNMLPELFREGLTVVGLVAYIIYLNPNLAFFSLVGIPLIIYPLFLIAKKLKKYSHRSQAKNADVITRLTEVFNNAEVIKANATEKFEMRRFSVQNWQFFRINMKATYVGEIVSPLMEIIGAAGLAAVIFMGGREAYNGNITPGEFIAFLTAVGQVFQPVRRIGSIYAKIQDAVAASERVFEVLDTPEKIIDGTRELREDIVEISYKDVVLRYENYNILDGVSLSIKRGENIALVGDSGGGKSTFMNMILRYYDPDSGEVCVNGVNIKEFTQKSLKHHISLVTQRIYIFQDTLEARVYEALRLADALDFVENFENGIYTMMSEAGTNLSGGQRQRIAIARAIYKHASVILFDEATSALDNESEKRIQVALQHYTKDKITMTIAHRLSTIEHADKILVLQKGKIVAQGSHSELLATSEVYQRLAGTFAK